MSRPVKAQEPSIEDILASIRRSIISEDGTGEPASIEAAPARTPSRAKADAKKAVAKKAHAKNGQDNADALAGFDVAADHEPDDPAHAQATAAPGEATQANASAVDAIDHTTDAGADDASARARPRAPREPPAMPAPEGPLPSPRITAVADPASNSLAHTVLTQNPRTLEDLVSGILRAWLDDNLPTMVERLVRAEIERVSRGRG